MFTRHQQNFINGTRKFSFNTALYGHESVKHALVVAQHSKCCFCESKIGFDGDVEHFRPKAGYCQAEGEPLLKPGYYWLAYDWDNLLLSCPACNQRFKKNYFPLVDPATRAKTHSDDIASEVPLFINPAERDPEEFISFRKEIPYPINDNPFGKATISALGLDREILNERRRDYLAKLILLRKIVDLEHEMPQNQKGRQVLEDAKRFLRDAVGDKAEYAAMARAAKVSDFRVSLP